MRETEVAREAVANFKNRSDAPVPMGKIVSTPRVDNGVRARNVHRGRRGRMLTSNGVSID